MTDKNTKQRKQMIKEMSKKAQARISKHVPESEVTISWNSYELGPLESIMNGSTIDHKTANDLRLKAEKEMSFGTAFAILVATLILFTVLFPLLQRAVDIQSLQTCEVYGDCAEVIKHINQ